MCSWAQTQTASFKHKSTSHPLTFVTNSDTAETLGTVMATLCIFSERKWLFPNIYGVIHPGIFWLSLCHKIPDYGPHFCRPASVLRGEILTSQSNHFKQVHWSLVCPQSAVHQAGQHTLGETIHSSLSTFRSLTMWQPYSFCSIIIIITIIVIIIVIIADELLFWAKNAWQFFILFFFFF